MNRIIKKFGATVENSIQVHPQKALSLLRAGYAVSGLQVKYSPDKRLLPHQRYAAVVSNHIIREPLRNPENSAVISVFLPCELLHAMDIAPQFVEGLACYLNGAGTERAFIDFAENSGIPKTYCSYHKALLGVALSGVLPKPRFILNTTLACDANTLTFRALEDHWNVPHFTVDVPREYSAETVSYVAEQLREMAGFMEGITGKKINNDRLRYAMSSENRSINMYRNYFKELAGKFMPNDPTSEMYKLFFTHINLGTGEAERYFKQMLEDVKNAAPSNGEIRILWAHTVPYWQDSIKNIFNFSSKYQLLSSDVNFDSILDMDENNPYESMARKLLLNTMCGPAQKRAEKLVEMANLLHADGVIYFNHWGCKQTIGGSVLTKNILESHGIPALILDGDGCDRDNINDGQMNTRLQAFLEMLEAAK